MVQLSHLYMTLGKIIALTILRGKVRLEMGHIHCGYELLYSDLLSLSQSSPTQATTTTPQLPSETQETPGPTLCR